MLRQKTSEKCPWKGVIFDRDGTLFDSLPVILRAFNHGIEPFTSKRPTDAEWFRAFGPAEKEVMGKFIESQFKQEAFHRFYLYYQQHFHEISLFPGIRRLLQRIRDAGIRTAIFTGGGRSSTQYCLEKEKVLDCFDALVTGDDVRTPKPEPEGVFLALDLLVLAPQDTLVVGDAGADVIAGQRAGCSTALARWNAIPPAHDLMSNPDYTFTSVSEFEAFLFAPRRAEDGENL